jgi:hypothetical protein
MKRQLPEYIRGEILARAFLLQLANENLSREAAEKIVAKEIMERVRQEQHKPAALSGGSNGKITARSAGRSLLALVAGMALRLTPKPKPVPAAPPPMPAAELDEPTEPTAPPTWTQRITDTFNDLARNVGAATEPEPEPQHPIILAAGSTAQLIPDDELPPAFRTDPTTQNWRDSIRRNEEIAREREQRGRPKPTSWLIG